MNTSIESQAEGSRAPFELRRSGTGDQGSLLIAGRLSLREAPELWARLRKLRRVRAGQTLNLDVSHAQRIDGGAMALLVHFRGELLRRGARCEFIGASPQIEEMVSLYSGDVPNPPRRPRRRPRSALDQIGGSALEIVAEVELGLAFLGEIALASVRAIRRPRTVNWKEVPALAERMGADAVPIVVLINFLLGLVIGLQSEVQLRRFGADIYMADLVGLSVVREIGPLMTAIIVCGRSGAAIAAELGSMAINEEIDALRTMGFDPIRFLVLPRMIALILMAPALTLLADLCGGMGGLLVGTWRLDLAPAVYLHETQRAVKLMDMLSGLIKSGAFGMTIALIACQQGLATRGGAEGLGRRTTSAVVTILFSLILADALFTLLFETIKRL
jgi:phospholipid/cholesterol/gamma-HCH transport system permease protein